MNTRPFTQKPKPTSSHVLAVLNLPKSIPGQNGHFFARHVPPPAAPEFLVLLRGHRGIGRESTEASGPIPPAASRLGAGLYRSDPGPAGTSWWWCPHYSHSAQRTKLCKNIWLGC